MNGMVLMPTECILHTVLNGEWSVTLTHPLDKKGRWKNIEEEAIIAAPGFLLDAEGKEKKQLFRISDISKTNSEITATAYPIFFDAAKDVFLLDCRPTGKTGQEALNILYNGTKYSGKSNITNATTAYYIRKNGLEVISGDDENSFLNRWGGETIYDNYQIIINERAGGDYGVNVIYGKNLQGMDYKVNMADVITRIVPVAYNGYMLDGDTPWVDSPQIGNYATVYTREVKFEDVKLTEDAQEDEESFDTLEELREELVRRCEEMYENGCDVPAVTIDIEMVDLAQTEEYKDYKILEKVGLGDTIHCKNGKLGVSTDARIVELEWDCILKKSVSMKIGESEYEYLGEVGDTVDAAKQVIRPDNTLMAEKIKGIMNAINTQLRAQKSIAQKQDVRAILFEDTDPESETYGAMCLGTQGFQIADHLTEDGRDWDWSTAFTAKGGYADVIIAGILSDKLGKNYWNLDTGEFALASTATVGGETVKEIADGAVNEYDEELNQEKVFDKLTNNGEVQGIFMQDGQLYINAAYIVAGILRDAAGLNEWNLKTGDMKVSGKIRTKDFEASDGYFRVKTKIDSKTTSAIEFYTSEYLRTIIKTGSASLVGKTYSSDGTTKWYMTSLESGFIRIYEVTEFDENMEPKTISVKAEFSPDSIISDYIYSRGNINASGTVRAAKLYDESGYTGYVNIAISDSQNFSIKVENGIVKSMGIS